MMKSNNTMKALRTILIATTVIFLSFTVRGQQTQRVSAQFSNASFQEFAETVEKQTDLVFKFNPTWTDSLKISGTFSGTPIQQVLQQVFTGTNLFFAIHENTVFITQARQVLTVLPDNFFNENKSTDSPAPVFDYSAFETREKERKRAE